MADVAEVLTAFRQQLVDAGIVRKPGDGPQAGDPPPMFVEPEDGAIAPGAALKPEENDATLILSIFWGGAISASFADAYRQRGTIDVRFRSKGAAGLQRAARVAARIRGEMFEPGASPGLGRTAWNMGGLPVLQTGEWGAFSRLGSSKADGFDHVWKAYVETYAG